MNIQKIGCYTSTKRAVSFRDWQGNEFDQNGVHTGFGPPTSRDYQNQLAAIKKFRTSKIEKEAPIKHNDRSHPGPDYDPDSKLSYPDWLEWAKQLADHQG